MDFGTRVKQLREELNLNRYELADEFGITYSSLSKYETNDRFPDKEMLVKIAHYFNVSVDYLLCNSHVRNANNVYNDIELDKLINLLKDRLLDSKTIFIDGDQASDEALLGMLQALEVGHKFAKEIHIKKKFVKLKKTNIRL